MAERVDVLVIGAGVIGLAIGRALSLQGREVIVLERHDAFGTETSSRNSEVIHAGIYYRPGGLRAKLCVEGKAKLYQYCAARAVPYANCEKLIVATSSADVSKLSAIKLTAEKNGVTDLEFVDGSEAERMEPGLRCRRALLSPSTGIIDSHALMLSLLGDMENAGGVLALSSDVVAGRVVEHGIEITMGGDEPISLTANLVVNASGLWADKISHSIAGLDPAFIPALRPAKGQYFTYSGKAPFQRLIYPIHTPDSQGVHYTRDLGGQARLGPDIRWDAALGDYEVDPARLENFLREAREFWPDLEMERLQPGYAGQRPKATGPGEEGDFIISGPETHGTQGFIGLYAMESPGLTSCLAIADYVAALAS